MQVAVDAELLRLQSKTARQHGTGEETEAALLMREAYRADRRAEAADERAKNAAEGSEERARSREEAQSYERAAAPARAEAGPKYDSVERREADASKLEAKGINVEAVGCEDARRRRQRQARHRVSQRCAHGRYQSEASALKNGSCSTLRARTLRKRPDASTPVSGCPGQAESLLRRRAQS